MMTAPQHLASNRGLNCLTLPAPALVIPILGMSLLPGGGVMMTTESYLDGQLIRGDNVNLGPWTGLLRFRRWEVWGDWIGKSLAS